MSAPTTENSTLPSFAISELSDPRKRLQIARQLQGKRWRMRINQAFITGNSFGFLNHPDFAEPVFFHVLSLESGTDKQRLAPGVCLEVEVGLRFDESKQRWNYAVSYGRIVEEETESAATEEGQKMTELPVEEATVIGIEEVAEAEEAIKTQDKQAVMSTVESFVKPSISIFECLGKIRYYASWSNSSGADEVAKYSSLCLELDPASQPLIDDAIKQGQSDANILSQFYRFGSRYGPECYQRPDYLEALAVLERDHPHLVDRAKDNTEKGMIARKKYQATQQRLKQGRPISEVRLPTDIQPAKVDINLPQPRQLAATESNMQLSFFHPCDIRAQKPRPAWQLLIDETGSVFDQSASGFDHLDSKLGRFVGLLLPSGNPPLPPLQPGWHAVDQPIEEVERVIQAILDARVGVLGINMHHLPKARDGRWAFGVMRLIELVLRLLPVKGPTTIKVLVEHRGDFKSQAQWPAIAEELRLRLADAYPDRAQAIRLSIQLIDKTASPYNGYVDALAYISAGASTHARACLAASGLSGTCFWEGDAETLSRTLEWMDRGRTLDGRDWTALLTCPEAEQPTSLAHTLLNRLGEMAQHDAALWRRYLEHVIGHFDSRSLDLPLVGKQVLWLERWMPVDQSLPPTLRLLWLTSRLARANHLGQTEQPWIDEVRQLADQLIEEDARLVCRAELNLAVTATNCFAFDQAGEALKRWEPTGGKVRNWLRRLLGAPENGALASPKTSAGLRYWGQIRSSLGQHRAFVGDYKQAVALFDEALESFAALSDPELARRESRQTQIYRAIALMDDPKRDDQTVQAAVEAVTGPLPEALRRLARSISPEDKYVHHLALRWLVHRPNPQLAQHYLNEYEYWDAAQGHPWPLIQLYRALLVRPEHPDAAVELALDGVQLAFEPEQGPVVQLIGACIRTIAVSWGVPWPDATEVLARLERELPLAKPRIAKLRSALSRAPEPVELLRAVLPFNFR